MNKQILTFSDRVNKLRSFGFVETSTGMESERYAFLWHQIDLDYLPESEFKELINIYTMDNLKSNLERAAAQQTGFSYNPTNGNTNPNKGFMVSMKGYEEIVPTGADLINAGKDYFLRHAEHFVNNAHLYMGCWHDGSQFVFDLSENVQERDIAIALGEANEQIAIWDCESGSEYRLMREGE